MSDDLTLEWSGEPDKTEIPVRGDCGHIFTTALARLQDGAEFQCPVCGEFDRFDDNAISQAKEILSKMGEKGPLDSFAARVNAFLDTIRPSSVDKD